MATRAFANFAFFKGIFTSQSSGNTRFKIRISRESFSISACKGPDSGTPELLSGWHLCNTS